MKITLSNILRVSSLGTLVWGLAACTTQQGLNYDIRAVQAAGQQAPAYRVSCDGLFGSSKQCVAAAEKFCQGQGITSLGIVDRVRSGAPMGDPRELTFMCGRPQPKAAPAPQAMPQAQPQPQRVAPPRQVLLQGNASFDSDSAVLTPVARRELDQFVDANRANAFREATVTGYTDSTGSDTYNQRLSEARARSVVTYLRTKGLNVQKFSAEGLGEADPVAPNDTAQGRAENRRVEIHLGTQQ